ncbi:MAG TPA: hypothetical protein VGN88_12140, partial [Phycisphaerae bacterium]
RVFEDGWLLRVESQMPVLRRRPRGGSSVEYILILALVVIPIALLGPTLIGWVVSYAHRISWSIRTPFG